MKRNLVAVPPLIFFLALAFVAVFATSGAPRERPDKPDDSARVPLVDISGETGRHVVIAARDGLPGPPYHAPDAGREHDVRRLICVGHGGRSGPMARSDDGGLTSTSGSTTAALRIPEAQGTARASTDSWTRGPRTPLGVLRSPRRCLAS